MKKLAICSIAAAALLLSSCGTTKVEDTAKKDAEVPTTFTALDSNINWEASEFTVDGNIVEGSTATILFANPTYIIAGSDGLNGYNGGVVIDGTSFALAEKAGLAHTLKAGSEEVMAFGDAYMRAITHATTINYNADGNLVISGPTSEIVYTEKDGVYETSSVKVDGVETTGSTATLIFGKIYEISGFAGVNNYNGSMMVYSNGDVEYTEGVNKTKMAGPKEAMDYENAYVAAIPSFNKIAIENETLILSSDNAKITFNAVMPIANESEVAEEAADTDSDDVITIEE